MTFTATLRMLKAQAMSYTGVPLFTFKNLDLLPPNAIFMRFAAGNIDGQAFSGIYTSYTHTDGETNVSGNLITTRTFMWDTTWNI